MSPLRGEQCFWLADPGWRAKRAYPGLRYFTPLALRAGRSPTVSCPCLCRPDPGRLAELVVSACVPVLARLETAASSQQASPACLLVLPALVELCAGLFADR